MYQANSIKDFNWLTGFQNSARQKTNNWDQQKEDLQLGLASLNRGCNPVDIFMTQIPCVPSILTFSRINSNNLQPLECGLRQQWDASLSSEHVNKVYTKLLFNSWQGFDCHCFGFYFYLRVVNMFISETILRLRTRRGSRQQYRLHRGNTGLLLKIY